MWTTGKRTKLGLELEQAALEILAHLKGEKKFPSRIVEIPGRFDVEQLKGSDKTSQ